MQNLYKPNNEAEAIAIKALLSEDHIDSTILSFYDTAYAGLYQNQYGWGVIKVHEKDYDKAHEIVSEWKDNSPEQFKYNSTIETNSTATEKTESVITIARFLKIVSPVIFGFSILLNVFFVGSWLYSTFQSNPIYNHRDQNGLLVSKTEWGDNYNSPYKYTAYANHGKKMAEFYDYQDIGRSTYSIEFMPHSKIYYYDRNANGINELAQQIFDSGFKIISSDTDENGIFEISKILDEKNNLMYTINYSNKFGILEGLSDRHGQPVQLQRFRPFTKNQ